jgi:protein-S-isoprenylcysteine O-methyltransferase Ste14
LLIRNAEAGLAYRSCGISTRRRNVFGEKRFSGRTFSSDKHPAGEIFRAGVSILGGRKIMPQNVKDNPGVIAPPPLIFLTGLFIGRLIHWFYPQDIFPDGFGTFPALFGVLLIAAGLGAIFAAHRKMKKAKTNIEPWKPTTAIVADGIYAFSRNPVYVAMALIYLGAVLIFNSVWMAAFLVPVLIVIHFGVILREEKYLENKFGAGYLDYKRRVRRWI